MQELAETTSDKSNSMSRSHLRSIFLPWERPHCRFLTKIKQRAICDIAGFFQHPIRKPQNQLTKTLSPAKSSFVINITNVFVGAAHLGYCARFQDISYTVRLKEVEEREDIRAAYDKIEKGGSGNLSSCPLSVVTFSFMMNSSL